MSSPPSESDSDLQRRLLAGWKQYRREKRQGDTSSSSEDEDFPQILLDRYKRFKARMRSRKRTAPNSDADSDPEDRILDGLQKLRRKVAKAGQDSSDNEGHPASSLLSRLKRLRAQLEAGVDSSSESAGDRRKNPLAGLKGTRRNQTKPARSLSPARNIDIATKPVPAPVMKDGMVEEGNFFGMVKESTAWDVYNNEARKMDTELVKDWRESLNSLLLFTAIFAAVLAAFIIESKKMLEQDPNELIANLTLFSINNNGNVSNLPFVPTPFEATWTAVSINSLLFASLGVTLIAALASVVSLQWVTDYDAAITRGGSSPEDRAKRRQFRFAGVISWKMGEIIAALPLLLYSSVGLFWAGALQWMWSIHHLVGYVVAGSTAVAALFYVTTTLLATAFVTAPFRTPLSRGLYWLLRPSVSSVCLLVAFLVDKIRAQWRAMTHSGILSGLRQRLTPFDINSSSVTNNRILQWIRVHFIPETTTRRREDEAAGLDARLGQEALDWLAQHLPVSADSHRRLILLITEVLTLSPESTVSPSFLDESWLAILNFLGWHYMRQILDAKLKEDDYEAMGMLIRCSMSPQIRDQISPSANYETDSAKPEYWSQCCINVADVGKFQVMPSENMAFLLVRDVPAPLTGSTHEIEATMKLIRWRNSTDNKDISAWKESFSNVELYSPEYVRECIRCFKLWLFPQQNNGIPEDLVQTAEAFDRLMRIYIDPKLHVALVRLLCRDAECVVQPPPDMSNLLDSIPERLKQLRDPCLAIIGGYIYDVPVSVEVTMTKAYMSKYSASLETVHSLLYKKLSMADSPALWQLRAAIAATSNSGIKKLCYRAAREPDQMSYVERIFQHPVHCTDHTAGPQHLLYHFNCDNTTGLVFAKGKMLFGLDLGEMRTHPVLVFLAFPGPNYSSFVTPGLGVNPECVERIREMCEAVLREPATAISLVTDIATEHLQYECKPQSVAMMLKAVESVMALPNKDGIAHLLRPMAKAIRKVRKQMMRYEKATKQDLRAMAAHADMICGHLKTTASTKFISSASNTRILSCARACTSPQAAIGWLPMFDSMSRDEIRMGSLEGLGTVVPYKRMADPYQGMKYDRESERVDVEVHGALHHRRNLSCALSRHYGTAARGWRSMCVD